MIDFAKRSTAELIEEKGDLEKIFSGERSKVCLILDNIRSVYNIGAIFRTCDAVHLEKLYLCGISAHPPRPDLDKTALHTVEFVPWEYYASTKEIVLILKKAGYQILGLEQTDKSQNYHKFDFKKPLAIIAGNEVEGIDPEILNLCDNTIEIPMYGIANSLNVTTAIGIVLYEIINKFNQ